jgi:hypothetical protein
MRKVFLSAAALVVTGFMVHGAFACELNRDADRQGSVFFAYCGTAACMFNPPQDPFAPLVEEEDTPANPVQDCSAPYFDPGTYSGTDGLMEWLIATVEEQGQYQPSAGFARSPMDANARFR